MLVLVLTCAHTKLQMQNKICKGHRINALKSQCVQTAANFDMPTHNLPLNFLSL